MIFLFSSSLDDQLHSQFLSSDCRTHGTHGSLHHSQPPFICGVWHLWYGIFPLASLG